MKLILVVLLLVLNSVNGKAQDTLTICSFNIQFLGNFKQKDNQTLAEILKNYTIVAIEELVAPPVDGIFPNGENYRADPESEQFIQAMQQRGFSYWISNEDTGASKNHTAGSASEWWIVFYKNELVQPDSVQQPYGFISETHVKNEVFDRVPYAFPFKSTHSNTDFTLIPVHLKQGNSKIAPERQLELKTIAAWTKMHSESDKDFIILGDCNIANKKEFDNIQLIDFQSLNSKCISTNINAYIDPAKGAPYDHVFIDKEIEEDLIDYSFSVIDLQEKVALLAPNPFCVEDNITLFRTMYSDHLPVIFQLVTGRDTD